LNIREDRKNEKELERSSGAWDLVDQTHDNGINDVSSPDTDKTKEIDEYIPPPSYIDLLKQTQEQKNEK
jgi:hypothetical protein